MYMKKFLVFSLLVVFTVSGLAQPTPPMNVYGEVSEDGNPAIDKTVEARFNGTVLESDSTDSDGFYDIYIPYDSDYSGEDIDFFVDDRSEGSIVYEAGSSVNNPINGDYRAPRPSGVDVAALANESVLIEWETDEGSVTRLVYGTEGDVDDTETRHDDWYNTTHQVNITDLSQDTEYFFKVLTEDEAGNTFEDDAGGGFYDFTTLGESGDEDEQQQQDQKDQQQEDQQEGQQGTGDLPDEEDEPSGGEDAEVSSSFEDGVAEGSIGAVSVNEETVLSFTGGEALEEISFTANSDMQDVGFEVQEFEDKPDEVSSAGKVYRYKQVELSSGSGSVSQASFNFKVNRAWVTNSQATVEDIVLKRYSSGQWQDLETSYTGIDGDYYRFQANSPGFSFFAVGIRDSFFSPVNLENISVTPLSGRVPLNISVEGRLVNTEDSAANRTVDISLGETIASSETYDLDGGEERNFSTNVLVENSGEYDLTVDGEVYRVEARQSPLLAYILIILLFLVLTVGAVLLYLQYTGRIDLEEFVLDYVGGEKERIEVEGREFTFKGTGSSGSQDINGHVTITVGFDGDEPGLREKRVYRQADKVGGYDWEDAIEEDIEGVERELSKRIRKFVHEVKEETTDDMVCSICMEEFDTEDGLHLHQSISHNIECDVCGKSFETVRGLHIHQGMTHQEISHDLYR